MLRKILLAAVAAVSVGVAALAPSSASAHGGWYGGWHGGGYHGWHGGFYHRPYGFYHGPRFYAGGPAYRAYAYGGCYVRRLVPTPWGPRWRLVNRCY
jgi:hypothetical protein